MSSSMRAGLTPDFKSPSEPQSPSPSQQRITAHAMSVDATALIQVLMSLIACLYITSLLYPSVNRLLPFPFPGLLRRHKAKSKVPISVNYHLTRRCNKECGFCFHTATTSHIEDLPTQKRALRLLAEAGMRKINFTGGEPFLYPKPLGAMIDYCKTELHLESVSIVTNGSLVKESFLRQHAGKLDILAVSCDSFNEATNIAIGRGSGDQVQKLYEIAAWCRQYGVLFKLNTVVNKLNADEDMNAHVAALRAFRWKCFQVMIVRGENDSDETLRNAHKFTIGDDEFERFCERHKEQESLVPEPNRLMAKSYLILDEYLRLLDRTGKQPSRPILEMGVKRALESVFWDEDAFVERGGLYEWTRPEGGKGGCGGGKELEC